jgi:hypothetical protein
MLRNYSFDELPHRTTSADGTHVLGWYVESHREDRYDEDTDYQIKLFEVASETVVSSLSRGVHTKKDTGEDTGKEIESVKFQGKGNYEIVITYADRSKEVMKLRNRLDGEATPSEAGPNPVWAEFKARQREWLREDREAGIKRVQERKSQGGEGKGRKGE